MLSPMAPFSECGYEAHYLAPCLSLTMKERGRAQRRAEQMHVRLYR